MYTIEYNINYYPPQSMYKTQSNKECFAVQTILPSTFVVDNFAKHNNYFCQTHC